QSRCGSRSPRSRRSFRPTATTCARSRSRAAATKSTPPTRTASAPTWPTTPRRWRSSATPKPEKTEPRGRPVMIRVWDPFVRASHWALAASFAAAWASSEGWERLHEAAGYVAGGLVLARIGWGFVGPRYARFQEFVRSPATVAAYLRAIAAGTERRFLGHNPAGGAMIVV